eukprot:scaffold273125_cov23-Tisochrysis_lutea.AAC.1
MLLWNPGCNSSWSAANHGMDELQACFEWMVWMEAYKQHLAAGLLCEVLLVVEQLCICDDVFQAATAGTWRHSKQRMTDGASTPVVPVIPPPTSVPKTLKEWASFLFNKVRLVPLVWHTKDTPMSCCAYLGKGAALEDLKGSLVGVAAVMAQHTVIGAWLQQMLCHAGAQRRNTDTHTNVIAADVLSWWHTEEHTDVRADVDMWMQPLKSSVRSTIHKAGDAIACMPDFQLHPRCAIFTTRQKGVHFSRPPRQPLALCRHGGTPRVWSLRTTSTPSKHPVHSVNGLALVHTAYTCA